MTTISALNFAVPQLSDKEWVSGILRKSKRFGCEYSFGNIYMWSPPYGTRITRYKDFFLAKSISHKITGYAFPVGNGDTAEVIHEIMQDSAENNTPFVFYNATEEDIQLLKSEFPNQFHITYQRGDSDYIYSVGELMELRGKKFHAKRNHISFFEKNYNWSYEEITRDNINDCLHFNDEWGLKNSERNLKHIEREKIAIERAFNNFFELDLKGGILRIDGRVVAYTVGEPINDEVFCVHIEKALADVRGAYPMINREFVRHAMSNYKYVNREEDLDLEGLRKAKLSYNPVFLCDKYAAVKI